MYTNYMYGELTTISPTISSKEDSKFKRRLEYHPSGKRYA